MGYGEQCVMTYGLLTILVLSADSLVMIMEPPLHTFTMVQELVKFRLKMLATLAVPILATDNKLLYLVHCLIIRLATDLT